MNEPYKGKIRYNEYYSEISVKDVQLVAQYAECSLEKAKSHLVRETSRKVLEQYDGKQWTEIDTHKTMQSFDINEIIKGLK